MKIGIPRALLYYSYFPFWKAFLEELGHEVILSSKTCNRILDLGVKSCVDDACLPIKIFHGHIRDLIGKVDKIFIPRLVSVQQGEYICPKFIGLPEMIKNSISDLPELLILSVNAHKGRGRSYDGYHAMGKELGERRECINRAIAIAKGIQEDYDRRLECGDNPISLLERKDKRPMSGKEKGVIGLIGHPYLLYDQHINMSICSKLEKKGYMVLYPENITLEEIDVACSRLPKKLFWSYGKKLLGSGLNMLAYGKIDGLIFLTSFGCGIDSFIGELLQRYNQNEFLIPYSTITLDEHSGHAGFDTRLEAFTDMMEWRNNCGYNIPTYGQDVYTRQSIIR